MGAPRPPRPSRRPAVLLCAVSATQRRRDTPIAAGNGVTANGPPFPNSGTLPTGSAAPVVVRRPPALHAGPQRRWLPTRAPVTRVPRATRATSSPTAARTTSWPPAATGRVGPRARHSHPRPAARFRPRRHVSSRQLLPRVHHQPGEVHGVRGQPDRRQDFVNFLTSPAFQAQLQFYLAKTSDPGGPPFVADASPILTATGFPKVATAGKPGTVKGTLHQRRTGLPRTREPNRLRRSDRSRAPRTHHARADERYGRVQHPVQPEFERVLPGVHEHDRPDRGPNATPRRSATCSRQRRRPRSQ